MRIEKVDNGYTLSDIGVTSKTMVFKTFNELVQSLARGYNEIEVGKTWPQPDSESSDGK